MKRIPLHVILKVLMLPCVIVLLHESHPVQAWSVTTTKHHARSPPQHMSSTLRSNEQQDKYKDDDVTLSSNPQDRRHFFEKMLVSTASIMFAAPQASHAAIVDERNTYAATDSSYRNNDNENLATFKQQPQEPTDEVTIVVKPQDLSNNKGLGLELGQAEFRTNLRVYVKSVKPNSLAGKLGIQPEWVVVSVNGQSTERTNAEGVSILVSRALRGKQEDLVLTFRNPAQFNQDLQSMQTGKTVTTQVAPAGDTTQRNPDGSVKRGYTETTQENQQLSVSQLVAPQLCNRGATTDDLLEISYVGVLADTGQVFDGSAISIDGKGVQGRGNDVSLFFVLGKQPFGQFPPGWDVGLQGMCVGERRRVIIPPALAYGAKGLPRRGIPPNATLQYDISLISINGLATPQ